MKLEKLLKLVLILPMIFVFSGCGNSEGAISENENIEYEEVKELIEESPEVSYKVRGSCNTIDDKSHCLDYIGSLWTEEQMKLNCGSEGVWSKNTCPYSNNGGCQIGEGTIAETVLWSYNQGAEAITADELPYEIGTCNALVGARWITPEGLLK